MQILRLTITGMMSFMRAIVFVAAFWMGFFIGHVAFWMGFFIGRFIVGKGRDLQSMV